MYILPELFYVGVSKHVSNFYKLWVIFILQPDLISDILSLKWSQEISVKKKTKHHFCRENLNFVSFYLYPFGMVPSNDI